MSVQWMGNKCHWNSILLLSFRIICLWCQLSRGAKHKWKRFLWQKYRVPPVLPVQERSELAVSFNANALNNIKTPNQAVLPEIRCLAWIPSRITQVIKTSNLTFKEQKWVTTWVTVCRAHRVSPGKTLLWTWKHFRSWLFLECWKGEWVTRGQSWPMTSRWTICSPGLMAGPTCREKTLFLSWPRSFLPRW